MNRTWTHGTLAALALGLALAGCRHRDDDPTTTGSQGGMTAALERHKHDVALPSGTAIEATSEETISSRTARVGTRVTARVDRTIYSASGDTAIPSGAEFVGRVTEIHAAPRPGEAGKLRLTFDSLRVGAVIAHNTRTVDIVLLQGSAVRLELTQPLGRHMVAQNR